MLRRYTSMWICLRGEGRCSLWCPKISYLCWVKPRKGDGSTKACGKPEKSLHGSEMQKGVLADAMWGVGWCSTLRRPMLHVASTFSPRFVGERIMGFLPRNYACIDWLTWSIDTIITGYCEMLLCNMLIVSADSIWAHFERQVALYATESKRKR